MAYNNSEKIYLQLKKQAKTAGDKEHTVLYISNTLSGYIKNKITILAKKELEYINLDEELGIISNVQAEEERQVVNIIIKSINVIQEVQ